MNNGTGLLGQYYNELDFTNFILGRVDAAVDFSWGRNAPAPGVDAETFSVRWTGYVEPLYSETYTFHTITDDGVRLWVNGELIIDQWQLQGATEHTGTIILETGRKYDIKMEYFDNTKGATAQLLWSSPTQSKQIIPQSQLYLPEPGVLSFSDPTFSVREDGTPIAAVTVTRTGGIAGTVGATISLSDGTADSIDYDSTSITVTFDDKESTAKTVLIPIIDDTLLEDNETVNLSLESPTGGATIGSQNTAVLTIVDNEFVSGNGTGLLGQYYNELDFTNFILGRVDAAVDFTWGRNAPAPGVDAETFSVRWSGYVEPLYSETYTFHTITDDGVRLWVNGELIIDQWRLQGATEHTGTIALEAGQKYDIRMEYFDNTKGATAQLLWSSPSQSKQIIPQSQLYLPEPGVLSFSEPTFSVREDGTPIAAVTVTRTDGIAGTVGATIRLSDGTADSADYDSTAVSVTFDNGHDQPQTVVIPLIDDLLVEGNETINLTLENATGGAMIGSQSTAVLTIVDDDFVQSNGTGLTGQYYNNLDFTELEVIRKDAEVDFAWGRGAPAGGLSPETFSIRWTGYVEPPYSETYTFHTITDDGVRLWVDGELIINQWRLQGATEHTGSIILEAGQKYDIKMEYFDNTKGATAQLLWSSPSQSKQIIPQSQLYPQPILSINNVIAAEGDTQTTDLIFTVSLSAPTDQTVTVDFSTVSNTAAEGIDYIRNSGTLAFAPGVTEQTIAVQVEGDREIEADENFFVNLVNPTDALITNQQGVGTIQNDDYLGDFEFPTDVFTHSNIANVRNYGARGDGITDDTKAIKQALADNRAIYFPNGTYLVSEPLQWNDDRRLLLQGESRNHTVIKLKDNTELFHDSANPQPLLSTFEGSSTGQSFQNSLYNFTVDIGAGNPGAIGIRFLNNNQGGIRDVTIQSSDLNNLGHTGLALTKAWPGPSLIKNVSIKGFDYGVQVNHQEYSNVFENLALEGQQVVGIRNDGNILTIRGLTSNNSVPVIQNIDGRGIITLIDGDFQEGSPSNSAIEMDVGTLYARNIATTGYESAVKSGNTVVPGSSISEYVFHDIYSLFSSPPTSLNLPIEETPEVIYDNLSQWVSVTEFGAIADDGLDDTVAIQQAFDSGKSTIYFPGGNYNIGNTLEVGGNVSTITGTSYQTVLTVSDPLKNQDQPVFRFIDGNQDVVALERFWGNYGGGEFHWIEQATANTLVLRNFGAGSGSAYRNTVSGGQLFIEDVALSGWEFTQQQVWARQLNPEAPTTNIINDGGTLWILGLKTEKEGVVVETINNGQTEVLGGLIYPAGGGNNIPSNRPTFINTDSSLSIAGIGESRYGVGSYEILIEETRNGVTQKLLNSSDLTQRGNGFLIPLYAGSNQTGDTLTGDSNNNVLVGGAGSDILTGQGGADTFIYNLANEGIDTIEDFDSDDIFEISASGFGGGLHSGIALSTATADTGVFVSAQEPIPIGTSANFLYNTTRGTLSFDLDGIGPGAEMTLANLVGIPSLSSDQFDIVA